MSNVYMFSRCNDDAVQSPVLFADGTFSDACHDPRLGLLHFFLPGPLLHYWTARGLGTVQLDGHVVVLL